MPFPFLFWHASRRSWHLTTYLNSQYLILPYDLYCTKFHQDVQNSILKHGHLKLTKLKTPSSWYLLLLRKTMEFLLQLILLASMVGFCQIPFHFFLGSYYTRRFFQPFHLFYQAQFFLVQIKNLLILCHHQINIDNRIDPLWWRIPQRVP